MWKIVGTGLLLLASQAHASQPIGCDARLQAVNDQLVFAKAHNNTGEIAGLETAARNIKTYCTDERLLEEQQQRVTQRQREVTERQRDLQEATAGGKPEKITKRQAKLEESQARLLEAERELAALSQLVKK